MSVILALDSGTTNTRAAVIRNGRITGRGSAVAGSRDTAISGRPDKLRAGVRSAIAAALAESGQEEAELEAIVASGMITSNMGLFEVPHLTAPAGREELAAGMVRRDLDGVSDLPVHLVPGVKNQPEQIADGLITTDMMRGEETETVGIQARLGNLAGAVLILPGSHTKIIRIDGRGRIAGCRTTLAGELAWSVSRETILAGSLEAGLDVELEAGMVGKGAACSERFGLTRALFSVRSLQIFTAATPAERVSFFMGAVFYQDILALREMMATMEAPEELVVGGRALYREVLGLLAAAYLGNTAVHRLADDAVADACAYGAWDLWQIRRGRRPSV